MITLLQACEIAKNYYEDRFNVKGLAGVSETDTCYVFSGGPGRQIAVGGVTLCIDKTSGHASVLKFPSKDSTAIVRAAIPVSLPDEFSVR